MPSIRATPLFYPFRTYVEHIQPRVEMIVAIPSVADIDEDETVHSVRPRVFVSYFNAFINTRAE